MNKTELRYELMLRAREAAGEILWFAFEPLKLHLGERCFFSPDFGVVTADRTIELHEIKAWWVKQGHAGIEDDARVKLQVAASRYPMFRFVIAAEERAGGITREWHYEEIGVDGARSL